MKTSSSGESRSAARSSDLARESSSLHQPPGRLETDVHNQEGHGGGETYAGERRLDLAGRDVVEGETAEASPEASPPVRQEAGARGGAGTAQAHEDLEKHVVRQGAERVSSSSWTTHGALSMRRRRRRAPEAAARLQFHPGRKNANPPQTTRWQKYHAHAARPTLTQVLTVTAHSPELPKPEHHGPRSNPLHSGTLQIATEVLTT
jgi:hypothetical protein